MKNMAIVPHWLGSSWMMNC